MSKPLTILILLLSFFASCKKEKGVEAEPSPTPTPTPVPIDDRRTVLLKDVVESGLPSPYFHFNYNDSNFVTDVSFASGFFHYDVSYQNKRVSSMINRPDGALLQYHYLNGKVDAIRKSLHGEMKWTYKLDYTGNQLKEVKWYHFVTGVDSVLERRVELFYAADGNLSSYNDYWRNPAGEIKLSRRFIYSNYDNGKSVGDFYLFKNFFEDLLFLPGVTIQKNNPRLVQILGETNDFEIRYTYTYQNELPVQRSGIFKKTRGDGSGESTQITTTYSYY